MSIGTILESLPGGVGGIPAAIVVAFICTVLQLISPDHLCTLMSLSAATKGWQAFHIGAAWGASHTVGTSGICAILLLSKKYWTVDVEGFERYGDYIIGCSLILCSLYFVARESKYVMVQEDGSLEVYGCDCHPCQPPGAPVFHGKGGAFWGKGKGKGKGDTSQFSHVCSDAGCGDKDIEDPTCNTPLVSKGDQTSGQLLASAVLGLLQGMCCPMALVSANFMAFIPTVLTMAIFFFVFTIAFTFATAAFALVWRKLIATHLSSVASPLSVYRCSCFFTFMFGLVWVLANWFEVLDKINYSEKLTPDVAGPAADYKSPSPGFL